MSKRVTGATLLAILLLGPTATAGLFPDDAALLSRIRSLARRTGGE